jgi:membrane-bound lytic murein transglycosylase D
MRKIGRISLYVLPVLALVIVGLLLTSGKPVHPALRGLGQQATTISLDPPENINFAGEPVPIRDFEVRERLEAELIRNIYLHSATILNIKRAARWRAEMTAILSKNGIPADFFYLCIAESHLSNATSPAGAKGFWQFMEGTGKNYDLEISDQVDERFDPIKSTYAAARYLKDAYRTFGNWTLVAASYNMGVGGVQAQLKRQKVSNYYDLYLNRETSAYVFRVLALKSILERPEQYGFILRPDQLYKPVKFRTVRVDTTITDLVEFAIAQGTTYKMLKIMNPWLLGDQLKVATGEGKRTYEIHIPLAGADQEGFGEMAPRGPQVDSLRDSVTAKPNPKPVDTLDLDGKPKADNNKKSK